MEAKEKSRKRPSGRAALLVSACLLGERCKYSGASNSDAAVSDFLNRLGDAVEITAVCPEVMGGLSTPRPPAEIVGERVMTRDGDDVTACFLQGAALVLEIAGRENCKFALLKARSPSCGSESIYDGTFSGRIVPGEGMTASILKRNGIRVYDETRLEALGEKLRECFLENGETY